MPANCYTCRHFDTPFSQWWDSRCCECCIRTPLGGAGVLHEPRVSAHEVRDARQFRGDSFATRGRKT